MDYLLPHMLRTSANRFPDKEALVHREQRLSYGQLDTMCTGLAAGLRQSGIERSDRVGIFLDQSITSTASIFGITRAGAAFVPIHHSLFPEQVAHIINDCGMRGLVTDSIKLAALVGVLEDCRTLEFVVLTDGPAETEVHIPVHEFDDFLSSQPAGEWNEVAIEKDLAAILYTSGSTGKPKGVMLSHANLIAGASIVSEYLQITEEDRLLAALPFSFDAGLNQLTTAIQQAGTLVLIDFVFAKEIVDVLEQERITGLAGVPPLWSLLSQPSSGLRSRDLPALRYITNTGGAMPEKVLAALREALPTTEVFLMYGLTEAFRSTYLPPEELDRRPTSMGKAIPDTQILLINDKGQPCGPDEPGELVHHGPTVSLGYWGRLDLTDQVLRPHPCPPPGLPACERVCYSGDLVKMDEEGFLYFVGRRDNLIKCSGFRVSPTEVEEAIFSSGKIREAGVIGIPDDVLGQQIKAFVVPAEGQSVTAEELLDHCVARMPRHMQPRSIEFLDALPKTSSGKIDYAALQRRQLEVDALSS